MHRHDSGAGGGGSDGIVLDRTYYDSPPVGHGMDRGRVRLGAARGEHQIPGLTTETQGNHLPGILHNTADTAARAVNRGGIADDREGSQDRVLRCRTQGLAGVGVEVMHLCHSVQHPTVAGERRVPSYDP